jgi:hypothetical protein
MGIPKYITVDQENATALPERIRLAKIRMIRRQLGSQIYPIEEHLDLALKKALEDIESRGK